MNRCSISPYWRANFYLLHVLALNQLICCLSQFWTILWNHLFQAKIIDQEKSKNLVIALEPEAASLYCRTLEMEHFLGMETKSGKLYLPIGTKYMIIDAGGKYAVMVEDNVITNLKYYNMQNSFKLSSHYSINHYTCNLKCLQTLSRASHKISWYNKDEYNKT